MDPSSEAQILRAVLEQYTLPPNGDHGVGHWARVLENGLRIASESGASVLVVRLFAILHDARRVTEHNDPNHGPRAAKLVRRWQGERFELSEREFLQLQIACEGHTHKRTHPDPTVQTCWDADRLDLGRVGITPDPAYLSTAAAKAPKLMAWAHGRGTMGFVPSLVFDEWGVDLGDPSA